MMKNLCFAAAVLAMAVVVAPLSAQITTEKETSAFTYVYDGADLAASADWTAVDYGGGLPAGIVEGTNLRYSPAGGGYYQWNPALSDAPGWTFEATYQITQAETSICGPFGVNIGDGTYGELHAFYGGAASVKAGTSLQAFGSTIDFTDGMHTLRFAEETGGPASLWIDGTLMNDSLSGLNYAISELLIGFLTGNQADGEVLIQQIAVDTTGAFAPVGQIVPLPPSGNDLAPMASESFAYKYDMDVDPTNVGTIDLDSNGSPDFVAGSGGNGAYSMTGTGALEIVSPDNGDSLWLDSGGSGVWADGDFYGATGITIEARVQIVSQMDTQGPCQIVVFPSDNDELAVLDIGANNAILCGVSLDTGDNTDDYHVFRVVRDTDERGGLYWLWRDGVLLNEEGIPINRGYALNGMYFGDGTGSPGGTTLIDYIRFESAAVKPIPEPSVVALALFGLLAALATRRR